MKRPTPIRPSGALAAHEGRLAGSHGDTSLARFSKPSRHLWRGVNAYNKAHVVMLVEQEIMDPGRGKQLIEAILEVEQIAEEDIEWDDGLLRVYPHSEALVIDRVGPDIGGWLLTGRTGGDAQRAPVCMDLRSTLLETVGAVIDLRRTTVELALTHRETLMPSFTMLQHAQPMTFGYYLMWFAEALEVDCDRLKGTYRRLNRSPAEVGVGMTTTFPVDRHRVAELLGFDGVVENAYLAHRGADVELETIQTLSLLALNVYRLCEDFEFWCATDLNFMELDDRHSGQSWMMPQKKNPNALFGAQSAAIETHAASLMLHETSMRNTSEFHLNTHRGFSRYHEASTLTLQAIRLLNDMLPAVEVHAEAMEESARSYFSQATDLADLLVREAALSFREAHGIVGVAVRTALQDSVRPSEMTPEMIRIAAEGLLQKSVVIDEGALKTTLDHRQIVEAKKVYGGPATQQLEAAATRRKEQMKVDQDWLDEAQQRLRLAEKALAAACEALVAAPR